MVDQAVLDTEPDVFDCEACEFGDARSALDRANAEAWDVYQGTYTRFAHDWGLVGFRVQQTTDGWPADEVLDLLDRLAVIYQTLQPPKER